VNRSSGQHTKIDVPSMTDLPDTRPNPAGHFCNAFRPQRKWSGERRSRPTNPPTLGRGLSQHETVNAPADYYENWRPRVKIKLVPSRYSLGCSGIRCVLNTAKSLRIALSLALATASSKCRNRQSFACQSLDSDIAGNRVVSPECCTSVANAPITLWVDSGVGFVGEGDPGRPGAVLLPECRMSGRRQAWSGELNGDHAIRAEQVSTDAPVLDLDSPFFRTQVYPSFRFSPPC